MTPKIPLILALLFLCGFVANLPTASCLRCYQCFDYPGSSQPCSNPSVLQCDNSYDSCLSGVLTAEISGSLITTAIKNCSISQMHCNESLVCGQANSSIAVVNGTLLTCSLNCCYGDLCNYGGAGNVTMPPWTNPPIITRPPFTTQSPSQGCGEVVNNVLKSPGYPSNYPNNMDCVHSVHIPHGMAMNIYFYDFDMESHYSCSYDYLRISNENNQTVGTYCGQRSGHNVRVTGRYAVIYVHSDGSVTRGGFKLFFSPVNLANATLPPSTNPPTTRRPPISLTPSQAPACGAVVYNVLKSPGYPSSYPNNMDCVYRVYIPHGMAMNIYFYDFLLEFGSNCGFDYLRISKGNNQTVGTYCGAQSGRNVSVTGRYAVLTFHSDGSFAPRGYKLLFSFFRLASLPPSTNPPTTNRPASPTPSQAPACGAVIYNVLKSPGYPSYYPNNMDCVYRVYIPHGMAMNIYFNDFYLETGSNCRYDYLIISNDNNYPVRKYCGVQSGRNIRVTGRYAVLTFHSDGSVARRGYKLVFSFIPPVNATLPPPTNPPTTSRPTYPTPSQGPGCGAVVNNVLKSPGYPGYYPNNMDCVYRVQIPPGMAVRIYFSYFWLESQSSCRFDYLRISNDNYQTVGTYCGAQSGRNISVTGRYAVLTFHSDGSDTYRGYKLDFYFVALVNATLPPPTNPPTTSRPTYPTPSQVPGCGAVVNNVLKSPGYPGYYPNNMNCVYRIQIPHGLAMKIYFSYFRLESNSYCRYDYLRISNDNNYPVGTYCGVQSGRNIIVTGRYAVITFHSDYSVRYDGYNLIFSLVPGNATLPPWINPSATGRPTYPTPSQAPGSSILPSSSILRPSVTFLPTVASAIVPVTRYPTAGPRPTGCLKSRIKYYINRLQTLLDQMEDVVDNGLGGDNRVSKREHIARVKKAVDDVEEAMKGAGRLKRGVTKTTMVDHLKNKAADLIKKLDNQQAHLTEKAVNDADEAIKSRERQKRYVIKATMDDQQKKEAADLMEKLDKKQAQYKRNTPLKRQEKKREALARQLTKKTAESIRDNLVNMKTKKA